MRAGGGSIPLNKPHINKKPSQQTYYEGFLIAACRMTDRFLRPGRKSGDCEKAIVDKYDPDKNGVKSYEWATPWLLNECGEVYTEIVNIESAPKSIDRHECENGNVYVNYILS